jgi:hypothetical protein
MDEHAARRLGCFVEEAARGLRGLDASVWRDRIDGRYRELEAAFEWLLDHGQADDALAMASALAEFLRITGRVATGRRWLDHAMAAAPTDDHLRAVGLYEAGMLAFWQGADEDACSLHGCSLQLARRLGDPTTIALALCGLARVALREDLDWARTLGEEALQTVEATDDRLGRANALHVLGVAAQMRGDLGRAPRPDDPPDRDRPPARRLRSPRLRVQQPGHGRAPARQPRPRRAPGHRLVGGWGR